MSERRTYKRYARALQVMFGERGFVHRGLTVDVSMSGVLISTDEPPPALQSRLLVEVFLESYAQTHLLLGVVQRYASVSPENSQKDLSVFALRVFRADELMRPLIPVETAADAGCHEIAFSTRAELEASWNAELRHGRVILHTNAPVEPGAQVKLAVRLPFANVTAAFECLVVQRSSPTAASRPDVTGAPVLLTFNDIQGLRRALEPFVG